MLYGYAGQILRVDLSTGTITKEPLTEAFAKAWIGGRGFVSRVVWKEVPPGADPLGPDNVLVIATGPLNGTLALGSGRAHFGAKSPATGGYGDSNMGGHFAPELKQAGYDLVIIRGQAEKPTYLFIDDDKVELRDAGHLWGLGTFKAEETLKRELGQDFQIALIGPAGEKLVKFACIGHDYGRQAGRTGLGAVAGSKRLKAVAVRGHGSVRVADIDQAYAQSKEMYQACFDNPGLAQWTPEGTSGVVNWVNQIGAFPTRNFSSSWFEGHQGINGAALLAKLNPISKGCHGCPTPCGKYSMAKSQFGTVPVEGPEYETAALVGGSCGLGEVADVAYINHLLDDLGLDTISGGAVIGFTMECFEKGLLTKEQIGREARFGDAGAAVYLAQKIGAREGLGDLLAEGTRRAAEAIGPAAMRIAPQVKGLEISGYESRYAPANMLAYMTCDIGAHHSRAWAITHDVQVGQDEFKGKAQKVVELQHLRPIFDHLGVCRLQWVEIGFDYHHYPRLLKAVTGWDLTWDDLMRVSEKVWNQNRCFFQREVPGFGRGWDYPPARQAEEAIPTGPAKGKFIPRERLDDLLDDYYRLRGWTADGLPTRAKLEELGLADVAEVQHQQIKGRGTVHEDW
ncbi:MAG TPA: aldehyde ferredoxin oxidoreductase family protein [Bacillota bacterium]|jgi:aldehyde:ferredoxin oxidoreductase